MQKRKIIKIDENKCTGCGLCIPNCPEGAIQIIDGKARLISDLFCDGLGACIGHCPEGAITIEEREAQAYDEDKVMENIVKQGPNVIKAHLHHLKAHGEVNYYNQALAFLKEHNINIPVDKKCGPAGHGPSGCPGSRMMDLRKKKKTEHDVSSAAKQESELGQWPVQLMLVPSYAPYLNNCDLLIAADCVPFAYADFHRDLLKGKTLLVGCPKLDDVSIYQNKLEQVFANNDIKSVTYAHMEVPCCFGLVNIIQSAIEKSGKAIPFKEAVISISGERLR
ncbi:MAG: 4Fe-4S dicluster domain-containing protein [Candidatus Omnitrophota bacterium]|jgi:ferredoxin|nr:MAG: 4Fe-4S dicluster domain-containing protein [Candidatus Omnitrophota bacterium]